MKVSLEEMAQPYVLRIIEDDKEKIKEATTQIWNQKKGSLELNGYRKGKVPQDIAEAKFGFQALYEPYIQQLLSEAVKNANGEIVDMQQVYPEKLAKDGLVMQAVVYLRPKVECDYSHIEVEKINTSVTDEMIDGEIEQLRESHALLVPVTDRGLDYGDTVTLSFTGYINGVPFKGGSVSQQKITLSKGQFIPGFAEKILGMLSEETKTIEITFPDEYPNSKELEGKTATFDVTVHDITRKDLPSKDDDFAQTCGHETYDQLVDAKKQELNKRQQEYVQAQTETLIVTQLLGKADIGPLPQAMVQRYLDQLLQQQCNQMGVSEEDFLKRSNIDRNKFDQMYYNVAKRDLKVQLLLSYVADKENLLVTDEEYNEWINEEAKRLNYNSEELKKAITKDQADARVKMRKAYDFLLQKAVYTEPNDTEGGDDSLEIEAQPLT